MSATNRGALRRPDDFYVTPSWCTRAILDHIPTFGDVLDPCAGTGAILNVFGPAFGRGIEIDEERAHECAVSPRRCEHADALVIDWLSPSLVITNPPFSLARAFVAHAIAVTSPYGGTVAMLLRLNWLASQERAAFHRAHPADVFVLPRRPSFTGDGKSDSTEYAWFVWGRGRGGRWAVLDVEPRSKGASR